ncbi:hypothetical protein D3C74_400860 [compost metagenome]
MENIGALNRVPIGRYRFPVDGISPVPESGPQASLQNMRAFRIDLYISIVCLSTVRPGNFDIIKSRLQGFVELQRQPLRSRYEYLVLSWRSLNNISMGRCPLWHNKAAHKQQAGDQCPVPFAPFQGKACQNQKIITLRL